MSFLDLWFGACLFIVENACPILLQMFSFSLFPFSPASFPSSFLSFISFWYSHYASDMFCNCPTVFAYSFPLFSLFSLRFNFCSVKYWHILQLTEPFLSHADEPMKAFFISASVFLAFPWAFLRLPVSLMLPICSCCISNLLGLASSTFKAKEVNSSSEELVK